MLPEDEHFQKLLLAEMTAKMLHRDQTYGPLMEPYSEHLQDVVNVLSEFGYLDVTWGMAGWLHDTLEDTAYTREDMETAFGGWVTDVVVSVTTPASIGNRKARLEALIVQLEAHPMGLPLKLADRISNVRSCWQTKDSRLFMYHKEYPRFRERLRPLRVPYHGVVAGIEMMWRTLDALMGRSS